MSGGKLFWPETAGFGEDPWHQRLNAAPLPHPPSVCSGVCVYVGVGLCMGMGLYVYVGVFVVDDLYTYVGVVLYVYVALYAYMGVGIVEDLITRKELAFPYSRVECSLGAKSSGYMLVVVQ